MTVIIVICVILFFIWLCSRANNKSFPGQEFLQNEQLKQGMLHALKYSPIAKKYGRPVSSMTEEEKFFEAIEVQKDLSGDLSRERIIEKINMNCKKTGEISDETNYEIAENFFLMLRLADLMNIPADKLSENFNEETKKYFFSENKKKFIFKMVCEEINNSSEEKMAADIAEALIKDIPNKKTARQFVLEELDAARYGLEEAQAFVLNSGFMPFEYEGAMEKSKWGNHSAIEQLQLGFRAISYQIKDETKRCRVNLLVVDAVMKHWKLGKYA